MGRAVLTLSLVCVTVAVMAQRLSLDAFFAEFSNEWVRNDPNLSVSSRYLTADEQRHLERDLTRVDEAYQRERVERARRGLATINEFDRRTMSRSQELAADVLRWRLEATIEGDPYRDFTFPFDQLRGVNISLVDALTVTHAVSSADDARNYVARLDLLATRIDEAIAEGQRIAKLGRIPPRFILQTTIAQMQTFKSDAAQNPLVTTLATKLDGVTDLSADGRRAVIRQATSIVETKVYPAWQRALSFLESLLPGATDDAGLWRLAGGAEAYAYQLRFNTTTRLTADEIHRIGLQQVARLEGEMDAMLARLGRTTGSLTERIEQIEMEQGYPLNDDGRLQILRDLDGILIDARRRARTMFDVAPRAPVVIEAFPRFLETTASGTYNAPSPDGVRPGVFRIPLRSSYMTRFGLRSLVYHETIPGHHFQIALSREDATQARFRQFGIFASFAAISEGWGLYAERLALESGWYDGDPIGALGALDAELFRARRLVVDTGLHAKRWTRQQAIAYGIEASEVDRYVVQPGQACAYMIGQIKILELRDKTRIALGEKFSLKDFHAVVLSVGLVPLDVLEREIDRYIQSKT